MIAGDYYNAGDATLVKTAGVPEFTTSIERNRIPNYQKLEELSEIDTECRY
jgi:hypothetical protein